MSLVLEGDFQKLFHRRFPLQAKKTVIGNQACTEFTGWSLGLCNDNITVKIFTVTNQVAAPFPEMIEARG
jgi:hypothetical protein